MHGITYRLSHTNVDGGGHIASYTDKDTAIREANRHAAISNTNGNPYGYRYDVKIDYPTGCREDPPIYTAPFI